mmetsp:Transcript_19399/g.46736  ORF Transcript_19399/g.46736 Transcript_19399/m.46736 type:complete len:311 (-) Transcript_19399:1066-1998(-)
MHHCPRCLAVRLPLHPLAASFCRPLQITRLPQTCDPGARNLIRRRGVIRNLGYRRDTTGHLELQGALNAGHIQREYEQHQEQNHSAAGHEHRPHESLELHPSKDNRGDQESTHPSVGSDLDQFSTELAQALGQIASKPEVHRHLDASRWVLSRHEPLAHSKPVHRLHTTSLVHEVAPRGLSEDNVVILRVSQLKHVLDFVVRHAFPVTPLVDDAAAVHHHAGHMQQKYHHDNEQKHVDRVEGPHNCTRVLPRDLPDLPVCPDGLEKKHDQSDKTHDHNLTEHAIHDTDKFLFPLPAEMVSCCVFEHLDAD